MDLQTEINNYKSECLWTEDQEKHVIRVLQCASLKDRQYYHIKKTYKLVSFAGVTKVAKIKDRKIMATRNNILSIINDMHVACGHKGEKKTHKKVSEHYGNIPISIIKLFISQCERCTEKSKKSSQAGIVVRPITVSELNQRGQVDLVDFQSLPDGDYKFILHYKEHLTKYSFLRPLTSKRAVDVAKVLLDIFLNFGAPHILQSDNGREFTASIIQELGSLWPDLMLVNGRPRHPQSQGSVERSNQTLKNSLIAWMRDNNTSSWATGLLFVQWGMNTTYHEAIRMEPYRATFGVSPKMGLRSHIPREFLEKISNGLNEEEMERLVTIENAEIPSGYLNSEIEINEEGSTHESKSEDQGHVTHPALESEDQELLAHPAIECRKIATKNLLLQAKKMMERSQILMPSLKEGDNVLIGVSQFDKGKGDPNNLIGVIIETTDERFKVGTKKGIISNLLERNTLQKTKYEKLKISDVPEIETSIRQLVSLDSVGNGQGYKRCQCTQ